MKRAFGFLLISCIAIIFLISCPDPDTPPAPEVQQVAVPVFSPVAGTYDSDQSVAISTSTTGAIIYYTTDGSDPTASSSEYSGAISVAGHGTTMTIRALAVKSGMTDSTITAEAYIINYNQVSAPTFSPVAGTYDTDLSVEITTATTGATIYYTTDGSDPTASSTEYIGAISVAGHGTTMTIKALTIKTGMADSTIASAEYTINYNQVSTPTFSPVAGTYSSDQSVTITTATAGATIYYTTDGSDPTVVSSEYSGAISVAGHGTNMTIKALAVKSGMEDSTIASASYTITYPQVATPVFSPNGGTYDSDQSVVISTATTGATIYYTADGSEPTTLSSVYSGAISVDGHGTNMTIKALAVKAGMVGSTIVSSAYTITYPQVSTPLFSQIGGTYDTTQNISISCSTPDVIIRYTIDGSTPSPSYGTVYSDPVIISVSTSLNAIAYKPGWSDSLILTADYTILIKIMASDAEAYDSFGTSVSISGDYAIIGAYNNDTGGINAGAAYIFQRAEIDNWDTGTKITASDAQTGDYFGYSVSISGDYAIVGAYSKDLGKGAAYIFHRIGSNSWDTGTKIVASDAEGNDKFGQSVSISGDYAIVGAPYEDTGGADAGAAYIFHRIGTNSWDSGTKIVALGAQAGDFFGKSVSISGDYAIIGAPYNDTGGTNAGAAYSFHRIGTNTWDTGSVITAASDEENNALFGMSVSISDGINVFIGAPYDDTAGTDAGAAYKFTRMGTTFQKNSKIIAPNTQLNEYFGYAVSTSATYLVIGSRYDDTVGVDAGAFYIFPRGAGGIGTKIIATNAQTGDLLGCSISISGNYVIVGASSDDTSGSDAGAAYLVFWPW